MITRGFVLKVMDYFDELIQKLFSTNINLSKFLYTFTYDLDTKSINWTTCRPDETSNPKTFSYMKLKPSVLVKKSLLSRLFF